MSLAPATPGFVYSGEIFPLASRLDSSPNHLWLLVRPLILLLLHLGLSLVYGWSTLNYLAEERINDCLGIRATLVSIHNDSDFASSRLDAHGEALSSEAVFTLVIDSE